MTALELAGLNLWGTQLVVLSACDTGRGDVKLGQGVYGLRRAFLVAGAETVVMSLWKVNDETTRALMEAYYRHLLAGQGRATALREAMRELRRTHPHPHYWAPFIAMGRDAPLRALARAQCPGRALRGRRQQFGDRHTGCGFAWSFKSTRHVVGGHARPALRVALVGSDAPGKISNTVQPFSRYT